MAKDDLTKAQQDLVDHIEAGNKPGMGHNNPPDEIEALKTQLHTDRVQYQKELDRVKLENNNLYTRVADALEVNEHHQNLNGKLQVRIAELEDDNQKISKQVEDQLERVRKAGL